MKKALILAGLLSPGIANAVIHECCPEKKVMYKYFVKTTYKKNHVSILAGAGYFGQNYNIEWRSPDDPEVQNHYDATIGLLYQRRVAEHASISFLGFTNETIAVGMGWDW